MNQNLIYYYYCSSGPPGDAGPPGAPGRDGNFIR